MTEKALEEPSGVLCATNGYFAANHWEDVGFYDWYAGVRRRILGLSES